MRILFAGNGDRGIECLKAVNSIYNVVGVLCNKTQNNSFMNYANSLKLNIIISENPNNASFLKTIKNLNVDLGILAGYGKIVKKEFISTPKFGCINLHAGKLPNFRGSSPMNWSLINGEKNFSISIIKVDEGIDTGPVLHEKKFKINNDDTIKNLHEIANLYFPKLLLKVLKNFEQKKIIIRNQKNNNAAYYPLRFPDDGIIFFDQLTSEEIHNRIRALTTPYPGVFTFYKNKKIKITESQTTKIPFYGEPGRIYRISKKGILVCAKDKCLWLTNVVSIENEENIVSKFKRYDKLDTVKEIAISFYENR